MRRPRPRLRRRRAVPAEPRPPVCRAIALACACVLAAPGAFAQTVRSWEVVPSLSVSETWTNNRNLSASDPQEDLITEIAPSLHLVGRTAAVQALLDYQLTGVYHAHNSELNELRNTFSGALLVAPRDGPFSLDARASRQRLAVSAFGLQGADPELKTSNTSDVTSLSVAPALRGTLAGVVDYQARVSYDATRASNTPLSDVDASSAVVHVGGGRSLVRWGLDGSRQIVDYKLGERTVDDRGYATLGIVPDPDVTVSLRGGIDYSDALGNGRQRTDTWGASVSWTPSPRTQLGFDRDHRYFGESHSFLFQHRMARSVWRYADSRDASTSSAPGRYTNYQAAELLFANEPDPVARDQKIRAFLQVLGADPSAASNVGFLTASRSLARRQEGSFILNGLRTTFLFSVFRTETQSLASVGSSTPDQITRQLGFSLGVSHRLTPSDSINITAQSERTLDAGPLLGNEVKRLTFNWVAQPGRYTSLLVGGRHVVSDGAFPYTESGLSAALRIRY
jgi:uncharacterized protein (PEP-CTERM system associated)